MSSPYADDPVAEAIPTALPAELVPLTEERIGSLDLIRGITILGILPVNMAFYMAPAEGLVPPQLPAQWWGDTVVAEAITFFFAGKMITQLAILFGAGLAIQSARADAAGQPFAVYYVRRMALLFCLGLGHALFLWYGDILTSYALVGLGALLLRRLSQRALLWCVAAFLTWHYLLLAIFAALSILFAPGADGQPPGSGFLEYYTSAASEQRIYGQGPWIEMVINRALHLVTYYIIFLVWLFWDLLACFLLGIYFLRRGVFQDVEGQRSFLCKLAIFGLGIGVPLHAVAVALHASNPQSLVAGILATAGALPQALGYLALTLFWHQSRALPSVQARLQTVGRMALTNYLMQSVICGLIFYSYGLGQFGKWGATAGFAVAVGIWALELAWSPVWLHYFTMGPVEWLWRSLADGRLRPFLRPASP